MLSPDEYIQFDGLGLAELVRAGEVSGNLDGILERISAEKRKGKVTVTRFKGLGEMNPLQLRESSIAPDTRRLARLTVEPGDPTFKIMDMLLSKKQAPKRRSWLQEKGDLAEV